MQRIYFYEAKKYLAVFLYIQAHPSQNLGVAETFPRYVCLKEYRVNLINFIHKQSVNGLSMYFFERTFAVIIHHQGRVTRGQLWKILIHYIDNLNIGYYIKGMALTRPNINITYENNYLVYFFVLIIVSSTRINFLSILGKI